MSHPLADLQTERALLGCVLADEALWVKVGFIRPEDFAEEPHRWIWEAMRRLKSRGSAVDHLTVAEELKSIGRLPDVGGPAYLMSLDQAAPVTANAPVYAASVREMAGKREIQARAQALVADCHDPNINHEQMLARAQTRFAGLSAGEIDERGSADVDEVLDSWDEFHRRGADALPFLPHCMGGLSADDPPLTAGWPMSLGVLSGRSGEGKTTSVASEAMGWLGDLGLPGGIIGLEDGTSWLLKRIIARRLAISFGMVGACRLRDDQQTDLQALMEHWYPILEQRLRRWPKGGMGSPELLAKVDQWIQWGARWIIIDHGLRVKYTQQSKWGRMDLAINETTEALAEMARPRRGYPGCAIIVNWHLNRDIEDEEPPKREHLKEAGYLDANARYILGIWKRQRNPGCRLITCVKANFGREGWTASVPLDERSGLLERSHEVIDFQAEREADAERAREQRGSSRFFGR